MRRPSTDMVQVDCHLQRPSCLPAPGAFLRSWHLQLHLSDWPCVEVLAELTVEGGCIRVGYPTDVDRQRDARRFSEGKNLQRDRVFAALDMAHSRNAVTLLMHGACNAHTGQMTGADRWAHEWAEERGVTLDPHPANWQMWNKAAGPMRNKQMAELGAHGVITFAGDRSTRSMLHWAREFGIPCWAPYRDEWTEEELFELFGR